MTGKKATATAAAILCSTLTAGPLLPQASGRCEAAPLAPLFARETTCPVARAAGIALVRAVFYRTLVTGIVLFWLVMIGLLVRVELFPDKGDLLPVPLTHVAKLIFMHQQPSDLVLYNAQRVRLGTLHLQPQREKSAASDGVVLNILDGTGATTLNLPGLPSQRMTFHFSLKFSEAEELKHFEWAASIRTLNLGAARKNTDPSLGIEFDGTPALDQFHYLVRRDKVVEKEASGTSETLLADPDLSFLGFDPRAVIERWQPDRRGAAGQLAVTAHRGTLRFNGEDIETYVISLKYADSLESTVHVSQLGQVLSVKTFAGYNLYDEALNP